MPVVLLSIPRARSWAWRHLRAATRGWLLPGRKGKGREGRKEKQPLVTSFICARGGKKKKGNKRETGIRARFGQEGSCALSGEEQLEVFTVGLVHAVMLQAVFAEAFGLAEV